MTENLVTVLIVYVLVTARKRSCGKVMFSHLSAILFTGRSLSRVGLCKGEGSLSRGSLPRGGSLSGSPPYGNQREVRILLECILVFILFCFFLVGVVTSIWNQN